MWFKFKRLAKYSLVPIAFLLILLALISSLFRALTPWASQYKTEIEQNLSQTLHAEVTIKKMETAWYWFDPIIKLEEVSIQKGSHPVVQLKNLLLGINLLSSVRHWQIKPGVLYVEDVHLKLQEVRGHWQIEGLQFSNQMLVNERAYYASLLPLFFSQQKIIIKNLSAEFLSEAGKTLSLSPLNLYIVKQNGLYYLQGTAYLDVPAKTFFQMKATLSNPYDLHKINGEAFFSINHLSLADWQVFIEKWNVFNFVKILSGEGSLQLWLDWKKGHLTQAQGRIMVPQMSWKKAQQQDSIENFSSNFKWVSQYDSWELSLEKLNFILNNKKWPTNQLLIQYNTALNQYKIYIAHFLMHSLQTLPFFSDLWKLQLKGLLQDTQILVTQGQVNYLVTQFSHLQWQENDIFPGINNVSGAFHWEPTEGRLEVFGENTEIQFKGIVPLLFKQVAACIDWKELSQGLRISVDHFIVQHPDLLINFSGVLDEVKNKRPGYMQLFGQLSSHNAQQWLAYLPSQILKPKLERWLKNNIKKIDQLTAEMTLKGTGQDFPYDKVPGTFEIKGNIAGGEVIFAPHWPVTKEVDASFQWDKRNLEINLHHANVQGTIADNTNLLIKDIGLNREVLWIHSIIKAEAKSALEYILASPLAQKLILLKALQLSGNLNIDLHLEVPLYPENDEVLALGDLQLQDDQLLLNHIIKDLTLNHLYGNLQFNQAGIVRSVLSAQIATDPIHFAIRSIKEPIPSTEIKFDAQTSVQGLKKQFNLPFLSILQGHTDVSGLLLLTDQQDDLDHVYLNSSLQGVSINLPPPLGKTAKEVVPSSLEMTFNPQSELNLDFKYSNKLNSYLRFSDKNNTFQLQKGTIQVGKQPFSLLKGDGLHLTVQLPSVNFAEWWDVFKNIAVSQGQPSLLKQLTSMEFVVDQFNLYNQIYHDVKLHATKNISQWDIDLKQSMLTGIIHYFPKKNAVDASFSHFILPTSYESQSSPFYLTPAMIPNLTLQINNLIWGDYNLGKVGLKGHVDKDSWTLESGQISTPLYTLNAKGIWLKKKNKNLTQMEGTINCQYLEKILALFNIIPAVEAKKGTLVFNTTWPGSFMQFSLASLTGELFLQLKDGRITHLDKETEEKLGLGKLLSVLSLQTIPRRLKLDFSDLSEGGYSFDEFKGNFKVNKGLMQTQNSQVDGPIAYATMKGKLNIAKRLYDLQLEVYPHITASLPIVATIAGGPIAGFATWVASKLIAQSIQKINGYTYKISGPWQQPVVQQINFIKP